MTSSQYYDTCTVILYGGQKYEWLDVLNFTLNEYGELLNNSVFQDDRSAIDSFQLKLYEQKRFRL